jgi:hypothetical protein
VLGERLGARWPQCNPVELARAAQLLVPVLQTPLPGEDAPAPVRLLAQYDNAILSHADRSRIIDDSYLSKVVTKNGIVRGTVLVDGFVQGIWQLEEHTLDVTPFRTFTKAEAADVEAEGMRMLAFAVPGGRQHTVRLGPVQ